MGENFEQFQEHRHAIALDCSLKTKGDVWKRRQGVKDG